MTSPWTPKPEVTRMNPPRTPNLIHATLHEPEVTRMVLSRIPSLVHATPHEPEVRRA
ncbi:hypothetical protein Hesp01_24440 [Herbidospora sp. NBRC 101105]|nr:hypothetical protein Hesp01_24440 [Herbidospora sp. NBRC 101105]